MFQKMMSLGFWLVFLLAGLLGIKPAAAQSLGKFSEWSEPVNLGPMINSEFEDISPAISPDGLSLYFASDRTGGYGQTDIWVSRRASLEDSWGMPQNLGSTINTNGIEHNPEFSFDGRWLYFNSDRPGGCGGLDLWVSWREDPSDDFGWESPVNLGCVINSTAHDAGPAYFEDETTGSITLYFHSARSGGFGNAGIYASTPRPDGTFGAPALVWELSSPQNDWAPTIRRDGLEILWGSDRPGGSGQFDLWVSTRETTADAWSRPVNLGPTINTSASEQAPALSPDGATLYFFSNRPGGYGGGDLYMATRRKLQE